MTETQTQPKFSAEMWAAFWAAPAESRIGDILADDIVGYWQGEPTPVRGRDAYTAKIVELVNEVPDLRLQLVDSATVDGSAPANNWCTCTTSDAAPDPTVRLRSAASTGSAAATASSWRTSSATTRSIPSESGRGEERAKGRRVGRDVVGTHDLTRRMHGQLGRTHIDRRNAGACRGHGSDGGPARQIGPVLVAL